MTAEEPQSGCSTGILDLEESGVLVYQACLHKRDAGSTALGLDILKLLCYQ